mgnify:CR=1 FL=1
MTPRVSHEAEAPYIDTRDLTDAEIEDLMRGPPPPAPGAEDDPLGDLMQDLLPDYPLSLIVGIAALFAALLAAFIGADPFGLQIGGAQP